MSEQERRVAESLTGVVSFEEFRAEALRRGYSVEDTRGNNLNGAAYHFYKTTKEVPVIGDNDPPTISMYWYIIAPEGTDRIPRRYTLEIQIRGSSADDGIQIKMYPFSPEGALLRLEEIEARLLRAWKAAQE